jgi:hypothetical protein
VWSADEAAVRRVTGIIAEAAPTLMGWTLPIEPEAEPLELWKRIFALTFQAELRAERLTRSDALVESDPERYRRITRTAVEEVGPISFAGRTRARAERWWRRMQRWGKIYSVLRLSKASLTFAGGADYIAWKINRHAGTDIRLEPWQKRHPMVAAIMLLPRLLKSGAIR